MTAIQFYHLTATPLERALPKLLEKIVSVGFRVALTAPSDERAEQLDQLLWTYDPASFLPHGTSKSGNAEMQPILICTTNQQLTSPFSPRLRGESEGGDSLPNFGKIGEGEYTSRDPAAMDKAKELRANLTDAEKKLWYFLQKNNLGTAFRKQHSIGHYIVDFACLEKNLVIELDGGQHAESQKAHDGKRTAFIEKAGFKVMRFWNNDVLQNIDGVLETISTALSGTKNHPPSPPASGGVKNSANLLFITDGRMAEGNFERVVDMFDGGDDAAVKAARERWAAYKNSQHTLTYFKQTDSGGWEKAA